VLCAEGLAVPLLPGAGSTCRRGLPNWFTSVIALFDPQVRGLLLDLGKRKNASDDKGNCPLCPFDEQRLRRTGINLNKPATNGSQKRFPNTPGGNP
jgi:hypothetical protein